MSSELLENALKLKEQLEKEIGEYQRTIIELRTEGKYAKKETYSRLKNAYNAHKANEEVIKLINLLGLHHDVANNIKDLLDTKAEDDFKVLFVNIKALLENEVFNDKFNNIELVSIADLYDYYKNGNVDKFEEGLNGTLAIILENMRLISNKIEEKNLEIEDLLNETHIDKQSLIISWVKNNKKKTTGIIAGVIALTGLIGALKGCSKDNKNENKVIETKVEDIYEEETLETPFAIITETHESELTPAPQPEATEVPQPETTEVPQDNEIIFFDAEDTTKTIEENRETINFDIKVEEEIINIPETDEIKEMYQFVQDKYEVTESRAKDYVNRAYMIKQTKFYNEAELEDIVEVIAGINKKDLFKSENSNLAQSFNNSFNRIVDNYLIGTWDEESLNNYLENNQTDIAKLDALKYFAKDNTDLDNFLTTYSQLIQNILTNPNDDIARDMLYKYLRIFATSLNGFKNDKSVLTDNELFNDYAIVEDYYDWYIAYESFIKPLAPIMDALEINNIDGMIIEAIEYDAVTAAVHENLKNIIVANGLEEYTDTIIDLFEEYSICGIHSYSIEEEFLRYAIRENGLEEYEDTIVSILKNNVYYGITKEMKDKNFKNVIESYGYSEYTDAIIRAFEYDELTYLMETAINDPVFDNICERETGMTLILGGE